MLESKTPGSAVRGGTSILKSALLSLTVSAAGTATATVETPETPQETGTRWQWSPCSTSISLG